VLVVFGAIIGFILIIYLSTRFFLGGSSATGPSSVASAPAGVQSIPGGTLTPDYQRALEQANQQLAQQAQMQGTTAIPTAINYGGSQAGTSGCIICTDQSANIKDYLDIIKIITIAPEKDEDHSFIKKLKGNSKIVLSVGHSDASYEETIKAIEDGISHATHTFNAMTPLNHRKPGIIGAIFRSDITCELIADTIHVHPAIFKILIDIKHKDKMVLVTDSMRAGCMKAGNYELGGQKVYVKNGAAKLQDGTLAGSVLTLNKAVKNMLDYSDLKINEAVAMASLIPAKVINIDNKKGSLELKKDADIVIFDENIDVFYTIVEGKIVFEAQN